jgi:hypothetical protein
MKFCLFELDNSIFSGILQKVLTSGECIMAADYDYENMEQESKLFPYIDHDNIETDPDILDEAWGYEDDWDDDYEYDDDMDGDWDSGMTSAGWGTDEDYGYYGEDY